MAALNQQLFFALIMPWWVITTEIKVYIYIYMTPNIFNYYNVVIVIHAKRPLSGHLFQMIHVIVQMLWFIEKCLLFNWMFSPGCEAIYPARAMYIRFQNQNH